MAAHTETIKDFGGRIIGYLEYDSDGNITVRDFYRVIKGKSDAKQGVTRDFYGRIIARGNCASMLLNK